MNYLNPIFSTICLAIGIMIFFMLFKKKISVNTSDKNTADWLLEEKDANFCTKKAFPTTILLTYDIHKIPIVSDISCNFYYKALQKFDGSKMANLTNYRNRDLKKEFGINYFQTLIECEETYFSFLKTLVKYGEQLHVNGYIKESIVALEYAIDLGCDTFFCYSILIQNYAIIKDRTKLEMLMRQDITCRDESTCQKIKDLAIASLKQLH